MFETLPNMCRASKKFINALYDDTIEIFNRLLLLTYEHIFREVFKVEHSQLGITCYVLSFELLEQ